VDDASSRTALLVARAAESRGCLQPGDWPNVAVSLLLEGAEDPAIAQLAGLSRRANGWDTEPLVVAACERHEIVVPGREESTVLVARLMADDLRARPAVVTAPMTRLLARLAPPDFESDLASRCFIAEECRDSVDGGWPDAPAATHASPGDRPFDSVAGTVFGASHVSGTNGHKRGQPSTPLIMSGQFA
jgi:hypothetical protein